MILGTAISGSLLLITVVAYFIFCVRRRRKALRRYGGIGCRSTSFNFTNDAATFGRKAELECSSLPAQQPSHASRDVPNKAESVRVKRQPDARAELGDKLESSIENGGISLRREVTSETQPQSSSSIDGSLLSDQHIFGRKVTIRNSV